MIGLWMAGTVSVCLAVEAWCQCICSALKLNMNQRWLLVFVLVSSALCNWLFAGSGRKFLRIAAAGTAVVLIIAGILWKGEIFAGTLNHIVNGYLRLGVSEDMTIDLYHEMGVTLFQRTAASAVLLLPLTAFFSAVQRYGKGKTLAVFVFLAAVFFPTLKTHLPDTASCWLMAGVFAVFFAMAGVPDSKAAWSRGAVSAAFISVIIIISSVIGGKLEVLRKNEGNDYYKVRAAVQENVVDPVEGWLKADWEKSGKKEENKKEKKKAEDSADDGNNVQTPWEGTLEDDIQRETGEEFPEDDSVQKLDGISRFSPKEGASITITREEKPESIVYQPLWYGGNYSDNSWEKLPVNDKVEDIYSEYPRNLDRLINFCNKKPCTTPEEAENFINKEFRENLTYDYEPGAVPEGKDFAEYFFFENKKGFCVHFAAAAALIYRIYGIPARYAEGYAVPAEAFIKQDDGSYAARVTGEMGHAWCEIYDGGWSVKEHTLPYNGPEREKRSPASDTEKVKTVDYALRFLIAEIAVLALIITAVVSFFVQAAVRRGRRKSSYIKKSRTEAARNMYRNIYDTAVFFGMEESDPLHDRTVGKMADYCGGLNRGELRWMKEKVQESLFYDKVLSKEEYMKVYNMHQQFAAEAEKRLMGFQKIKYRYLLCLG